MEKILKSDKILLGTCYYPEHWDRGLWQDDLLRMKKNGIAAVRVAEFAWNKFEPVEEQYAFDFFDDFLKAAAETDMSVIFCTPTATPPAWLTYRYPEVLNADINGVPIHHGERRHYNYNSPIYRRFSAIITEKIAEHYGRHPCIIGWQIDNEINCEISEFYSESDTLAFREFLKKKYQTLDNLNTAWGTVFWNQTYTAWDEVFVPRKTASNSHNPHLALDYYRFVSESARSFVKLQSDILRKYIKNGDFITTNGIFVNLDSHRMTAESLDFVTYDSYPDSAYCLNMDSVHSDDFNDRKWSRHLSEVRSISKVFGIMEQQSGSPGNTRMEAPQPRPGQMTLWTMQSIAHGADYVSFFRWRTCVMGTEINWHGILDYSNRDNRRLAELAAIHQKTQAISCLAGSVYEAAFGVLKDYDNVWDARLDVWHRRLDEASEAGIFRAAQLTHTPFDYVYIDDFTGPEALSKYPVLFYPHAVIMTEKRAGLLEKYVEAGGILILGCRTAYKDSTGKCPMVKLPGLLQNLSGVDVTEYTFTAADEGMITVDWDGTELEAPVFNDVLEPLGNARVLGRYTKSYYVFSPAFIVNEYGKGKVYYFGASFSRQGARVFLEKLGIADPYRDLFELPECCELAVRKKDKERFFFILNYTKDAICITLKTEMTDLYSGCRVSGAIELPAYGTGVYQIKE
ncbi:MAG: beta-galactosidase [Treponema sp.]|jgi:beta-galactosidase|nr:beta-galactosidase [Treponema sp.]